MAAGNEAKKKDQEMAARLKNDPKMRERFTGRCAVCLKIVANSRMVQHIDAHARGAQD